jgi:hypothetical protein
MTAAVVLCFLFIFVSTFKAFETAKCKNADCNKSTELFQDFLLICSKLDSRVIINLKCNHMQPIPEDFKSNSYQQNTYLINGELKKWEGETINIHSTISSTEKI